MDSVPVRLTILDDDPLQGEVIARACDSAPGYEVVGHFLSLADLRSGLRRLNCDIALVDIQLPDGSGLEAIRMLKALKSPPKVVILTVVNDSATLFGALQAGADGYVLKRGDPKGILQRLGDLLAGEVPISAAIARRLIQHFRQIQPGHPDALHQLTPSENAVLGLLARGLTNQEIANERGVALATIRSQLASIYEKLHVRSRTEAVALYHRQQ